MYRHNFLTISFVKIKWTPKSTDWILWSDILHDNILKKMRSLFVCIYSQHKITSLPGHSSNFMIITWTISVETGCNRQTVCEDLPDCAFARGSSNILHININQNIKSKWKTRTAITKVKNYGLSVNRCSILTWICYLPLGNASLIRKARKAM